MKHVEFAGLAMEAASAAPIVLLRELDEPHRLLPIFIGGPEATAIALAVSGQSATRPLTYDLMAALVHSLDGHVDAVEVTGLEHGAFHATLALHGPGGDLRVDTRPSDAIALALRVGAPLYVADAILDEAGTTPDPTLEAAQADIDQVLTDFHTFLDTVDPDDFAGPGSAQPDSGADD